jgi:hypothetical protein
VANIVVFYWGPGSGGDFINSLLIERQSEYQSVVENITLTAQGRVTSILSPFFVDNFTGNPEQWYWRNWTTADCDTLIKFVNELECKWFVIPTHRLDQVDFLKSQIKNCRSIGITYPNNMFPLVLKNWCKKVAAVDADIQKIYNQPLHQYLRDHNKFGEFVLKEQLAHGTSLSSSVEYRFDIEILLEDIYNLDLSVVKALLHDHSHVDKRFSDWIQRQSKLYSHCYTIPKQLKQSLGYNSKSKNHGDLSVSLDTFDNMLIKHHCATKNIPKFNTLQQAANFFKNNL